MSYICDYLSPKHCASLHRLNVPLLCPWKSVYLPCACSHYVQTGAERCYLQRKPCGQSEIGSNKPEIPFCFNVESSRADERLQHLTAPVAGHLLFLPLHGVLRWKGAKELPTIHIQRKRWVLLNLLLSHLYSLYPSPSAASVEKLFISAHNELIPN